MRSRAVEVDPLVLAQSAGWVDAPGPGVGGLHPDLQQSQSPAVLVSATMKPSLTDAPGRLVAEHLDGAVGPIPQLGGR